MNQIEKRVVRLNFLVTLLLSVSLNCFSQKGSVFQKIEKGELFSSEKDLMGWLDISSKDTLRFLEALKCSPIDSVSEDKLLVALPLIKKLADASSSPAVKSEVVNFFLISSKSRYSSVSSKSFGLLKSSPAQNFDGRAIDSLILIISKNPRLYADAVLIAGYINKPILIDAIKRIFPYSRNFTKQERWQTYKVLARLGDSDALNFCINRVKSLPPSDQIVDFLYPDLVYIHRKEAVDVLVAALYSDEPLCSSPNPNSESKIVCGYRVMELLAPVVEGFPLKTLPSGDLDVADYKKALDEVREWFKKIGSNYSLVKLN